MKRNYLFLGFIVALGFILRFYQLGEIPVSLHRDEAFLGYNAYSIFKTGKDISGNFLPIHLESFFFSPAGYSYLSIPFIVVFGLSEFSIRAASAFFGTLTIPIVFFISHELFDREKKRSLIALASSLFLAISPWHVNLSRVAVENTIVVFFVCLGIYLFQVFLKRKTLFFLIISFGSFALNLFIYQAPRVFLPIFIPLLGFALSGFKNIKSRWYFPVLLYLLFIIIPILFIITSNDLSWRIKSLSIFNNPQTLAVTQEQNINDSLSDIPYFVSRFFHNKLIGFSLLFTENFFKHLSFDFLFSDSSFPDRFRIPRSGLLYIFELPLVFFALYKLFGKNLRHALFISGWALVALMGSALTYDDVPNMQRTLMAAPALSILSGYGLVSLISCLKNKKLLSKIFPSVFLLIAVFNLSYFVIQYFVQGKFYRTWYRQDGYRELVLNVNKLLPNYEKALVTSRESAPTIFFLFYNKYDPRKFQNETKEIDMRQSDHVDFGKYEFSEEECPLKVDNKSGEFTGIKKVLYVNSSLCPENIENTIILKTIKRIDGSEVFRIYEVLDDET